VLIGFNISTTEIVQKDVGAGVLVTAIALMEGIDHYYKHKEIKYNSKKQENGKDPAVYSLVTIYLSLFFGVFFIFFVCLMMLVIVKLL